MCNHCLSHVLNWTNSSDYLAHNVLGTGCATARAEARAATLTAPKLLCHAICIPNYSTIPAESMANKSIELNCDFYACMISLINTLCARQTQWKHRERKRTREREREEGGMQAEKGRCIESNNNNRAKLFYCHQFKFIVCSLLSSCSFCLLLSPPSIFFSPTLPSLFFFLLPPINISWPHFAKLNACK